MPFCRRERKMKGGVSEYTTAAPLEQLFSPVGRTLYRWLLRGTKRSRWYLAACFFRAGPKERTFSVRQATKERAKKLQRHPSADSRQQHTSQTSLAICLPPPGKQGLPRGALAAERCFPSLTHRTSVSRKYTPWARLVDEFGVQVASWFESSSSLTLQKHREFFLSLWTGIP